VRKRNLLPWEQCVAFKNVRTSKLKGASHRKQMSPTSPDPFIVSHGYLRSIIMKRFVENRKMKENISFSEKSLSKKRRPWSVEFLCKLLCYLHDDNVDDNDDGSFCSRRQFLAFDTRL
jgi:hypothetical protein